MRIAEPLHPPMPAGRGGIVACSQITCCTWPAVSCGTFRRKQDHAYTGNGALWHHDGFRGRQVSCPPNFLAKCCRDAVWQPFVAEIGVTPVARSA